MKILLVQLSYLGDVILSTPAIAALRKLYPNAELWMLTTPLAKALVASDPELKGVIAFDKRGRDSGVIGLIKMAQELKKQNFDLVYSIHRSFRTALLLWLANIPKRIGFSESRGSFFYTKRVKRNKTEGIHDVIRTLSLFETTGLPDDLRVFAGVDIDPAKRWGLEESYVVLAPGSAWATKRWSGFRRVAESYISSGKKVVVVGAKDEQAVGEDVSAGLNLLNLTGKSSLEELCAVIRKAGVLICNDSMTLHLASAFKTPVVPIFCATSPKFGFGPWKTESIVLEVEGLSCKPCSRHGGKFCPTGTKSCMTGVKSETVVEAASRIFRS